jgi:hypothetical protein
MEILMALLFLIFLQSSLEIIMKTLISTLFLAFISFNAFTSEEYPTPGDRILFKYKTGNIKRTFTNNQILIQFDNQDKNELHYRSELSFAINCDVLCVGDRVLTPQLKTGIVLELFSNYKAKIKLDDQGTVIFGSESYLSKSINEKIGFHVGQRVVTHGLTGKILEIFENNRVFVQLDETNEVVGSTLSEL